MQRIKSMVKSIPGASWLFSRLRDPGSSHGERGIKRMGHREYVGGLWDEVGKLQFDLLLAEGLRPEHYLLDVACGSLRGGRLFIPYLEAGHYLGIEKEESLIESGIADEIGKELNQEKRPCFVVSSSFEFEKFTARPDFALAQSLFTHLPAGIINSCFAKLRPAIADGGRFYATFRETETEVENSSEPHDQERFLYTRGQMEQFGSENGWRPEYIGDWGHPRGQVIVRYWPA